jgi:integrase
MSRFAWIALTTTRFHDFRHSCGTPLHSQRVPARAITEVLGHTELLTTERYTHATRAMVSDGGQLSVKMSAREAHLFRPGPA